MLNDSKCSLCENDSSSDKVYYQVGDELWRAADICASCSSSLSSLSVDQLQEKLKVGLNKKFGFTPVHLVRAKIGKFFPESDKAMLANAYVYNNTLMQNRIAQVKSLLMKGM